jgi:hypothetical protein
MSSGNQKTVREKEGMALRGRVKFIERKRLAKSSPTLSAKAAERDGPRAGMISRAHHEWTTHPNRHTLRDSKSRL